MVKFLILKIDQPNIFLGQDLSILDKVNGICTQIKNSNSKMIMCSDYEPQRIYLANLLSEIVRVRIISITNMTTYRCLLIDQGRIEEIRRQRLYSMPSNLVDIDPAVKMIKIPGICPAGMSESVKGINIKVELSEYYKWSTASFKFVARIFEENQTVYVSYVKQVSKDKMLANVNVQYLNRREDLKELLIKERYAFQIKENETDYANSRPDRLKTTAPKPNETPTTLPNVENCETDSLDNISVSSIIIKMKTDEQKEIVQDSPHPAVSRTTVKESQIFNDMPRDLHHSLDELSCSVLKLKVKCWHLSKNLDTSVFEYLEPIRPIVSYRKEHIIDKFLKDALIAYNTKLLLLIQAYMIPTILRGVNMVSIAPHRKGKSMGLLMPILQMIATKPVLPTRSFNPLAIIICSSWKKVNDLSKSAEKFVKFIAESNTIRRPRIVAAYGGSMKKMTMVPILQGCDLLIITPSCLLSWLKQHEFFKLNELEMFCLDDAENIIAENLETLKAILVYKRTGAIERGSEPGQFITATNWTSGLESYIKFGLGDVFTIAVNDTLELAVIERMQQKIIEYDNAKGELYPKLMSYLELIESSIKKTVIFASGDEEIDAVYKYLMQKTSSDLKLMTGAMDPEELMRMTNEWNDLRGYINMPILLISDDALRCSDVSIFNADIIIHVDINEHSFGSRLNFLREKYSELSFLKKSSLDDKKICNSFIFVCINTINLATANFLNRFLGRCNSERPGWLKEKAIDYILSKERSRGYYEICPRIKGFGECKLPACEKRHMVISDVDKPMLPNNGYIKFRLLYLESPSHFFVRISDFKSPSNVGDNMYKSQYITLKVMLSNFFNDVQNIQGVNLNVIQPGFVAAIKTRDIVERVVVTKMKSNKAGCIMVKLIDHGSHRIVEQADLLHLPRELCEVPPQAIEVYVIGMKPIDNDEYYSEESCEFAQDFLSHKDFFAVIRLCIGSTLWIDSVTQRVHHTQTNITVYDNNLLVNMLEKNLVEKNCNHIDKLIRLCTGKIDIWKANVSETVEEPVAIMRKFSYVNKPVVFETLSLDDEDDDIGNECTVVHVIAPNCIFLNNRQSITKFKKMHKEIASLLDSIELLSMDSVKISDRVLFYNNEEWQRGYVIGIDDVISVFSLDCGTIEKIDMNSQLKRLPSEYQQLPYRAILCALHYCNHNPDSYAPDVVDNIKHYCGSLDKRPILNVRAYHTENMDCGMFCTDVVDIANLDLFQSMKRYAVSISNRHIEKADEMLHYVLIRNQSILPSMEFIHEILPESQQLTSRLLRNGSIPHLTADLLCTRNDEKRVKLAQNIERIIDKKKEMFIQIGTIPVTIPAVLHSIAILIHFVNERSIYMYIYRSLNMLLVISYENKCAIANSGNQLFNIRSITSILLDYKCTIYHMLRHLSISVRNNQVDECQVMLDNFRMMLLDHPVVKAFFEDNTSWYIVMGQCISALVCNEKVYNMLMDILVQLVMLWDTKKCNLNEMLTQCCLAFHRSNSVSIFNTSLSLICCFVNLQNYSNIFRNLSFFDIVFDKLINHYKKIGHWDNEFHNNALDLLINMWRNGSANKVEILAKRKLSVEIEWISKQNPDKTVLSEFVTNILLDESFALSSSSTNNNNSDTKQVHTSVPDIDALDWLEGKNTESKNYRKSFNRVFCPDDETESSSDERTSSNNDSDSSDAEVTPFLGGSCNPADEDNVLCFERA